MEQTSATLKTGTTFLRTFLNGANALAGVGILSIPYALSQGGWLSLILLFVMAAICCYTGVLLKKCMDSNSLVKTYPDIGELAFGRKGRIAVAIFMYLELYLVAIEFLILEGDNLVKLFPHADFSVGKLVIRGRQGFVLLATVVVLPTTWLTSLGLLAYVSVGGVVASVVVLVCVIWAGAVDGVGFHGSGSKGSCLTNWHGISTAVSLYAFCFSGHAVFPTLYTSMRNKNKFSKVLVICFVLCTMNYGSMAIVGYMMYGEGVKSQVTLNLPTEKLSSKIAIYTTLINPLTKYALLIMPIASTIEDHFDVSKNLFASLTIRTLIVISTVIVALAVPFFGYVMAFTGSFLSSTATMLLPCLCYVKIFKNSRQFDLELLILVVIMLLGASIGVIGTYTSLKQIIQNL